MARARPSSGPTDSPGSRRQRLASFETARKKEQRRRMFLLLGICVVLAAALLAYPIVLLVEDSRARNASIGDLGVSLAQAGCDAVAENPATGNQEHVADGTVIQYDRYPPDSGKHFATPAPFTRRFYTAGDRPEVGTLVHNLEHGYTVAWYREDLPDEQIDQLEKISRTFTSEQFDPADKFIAAPWTAEDPEGFPEGKNVVLTRWFANPQDPSNQTTQRGVRQACSAVSGEAIADFMTKYPATNSPEPNAA